MKRIVVARGIYDDDRIEFEKLQENIGYVVNSFRKLRIHPDSISEIEKNLSLFINLDPPTIMEVEDLRKTADSLQDLLYYMNQPENSEIRLKDEVQESIIKVIEGSLAAKEPVSFQVELQFQNMSTTQYPIGYFGNYTNFETDKYKYFNLPKDYWAINGQLGEEND